MAAAVSQSRKFAMLRLGRAIRPMIKGLANRQPGNMLGLQAAANLEERANEAEKLIAGGKPAGVTDDAWIEFTGMVANAKDLSTRFLTESAVVAPVVQSGASVGVPETMSQKAYALVKTYPWLFALGGISIAAGVWYYTKD